MTRYKSIFKESNEAYKEILNQLSNNKFIAMTGAKNFVHSNNGNTLTFKIGSGAKKSIAYVRITLTGKDLYDIEFINRKSNNVSQYNYIEAE